MRCTTISPPPSPSPIEGEGQFTSTSEPQGRRWEGGIRLSLLVIYRPAGPTGGDDQLAADRPGLLGRQERRHVGDFRGIHHAANGVAAWGVRGEVASFHLLWRNSQLGSAGGEQARGALGASHARVDATDRNPIAA